MSLPSFLRRPRWFEPLIGGLLGLFGGIAGVLIGLLLGCLIHELLGQFHRDKETLGYFENPGYGNFHEEEPGLAAYCALGVLIAVQPAYPERRSSLESGAAVVKQVARGALSLFPAAGEGPLVESLCQLAFSRRASLNIDLLAESLAARRKSRGDLDMIAESLQSLAQGDKAEGTAEYIRSILDPQYRAERKRPLAADPWRLLGLTPGVSMEEVKSRFRKLAIRFHPDARQGPEEEDAGTFIAIKEAYREIMREFPRKEA
jgi:hypothetical protein